MFKWAVTLCLHCEVKWTQANNCDSHPLCYAFQSQDHNNRGCIAYSMLRSSLSHHAYRGTRTFPNKHTHAFMDTCMSA